MALKGNQDVQYWMMQFTKGSKLGFDYFFNVHYQSLCYFANRLTQDELQAEDIVSECFVKLWKKHPNFETAEKIKAFLYISCRNLCMDYFRQMKRKTIAQEEYYRQLNQNENTILHQIIEAEFMQLLKEEINRLPKPWMEVFYLIYFEGKKTDEIAVHLNLSVKTVRNYKAMAVEKLKTSFLKKGISGSSMLAFLLFIHGGK